MINYWKFDIERFLKDYPKWSVQIAKLEEQRDDLLGLKGLNQDTPVQTSSVSDTVGNTVVIREPFQAEIDELEAMRKLAESALGTLSEREREVINVFFYTPGYISYGVDNLANKWHCSVREIYNIRRKALGSLTSYLERRLLSGE